MPGTSLAAVVPCYNAGFRVRPVVEGLAQQLEHVIVVDDGSTDGAVEALADTAARVVAFPENRGKGHAMLAGFRAALDIPFVTCVAIIDADGQHDPTELPRLFQAFREEEADLVIGSRVFDERNVPLRSRVGNKLTRTITHLLLGQEVPDTQSGYRLHSRRFLEEVLRVIPGGRYETEMEIVVLAVPWAVQGRSRADTDHLRNRQQLVPFRRPEGLLPHLPQLVSGRAGPQGLTVVARGGGVARYTARQAVISVR